MLKYSASDSLKDGSQYALDFVRNSQKFTRVDAINIAVTATNSII